MIGVCLYVYECALLERWVYVLCYVSCLSFFIHVYNFFYFTVLLILYSELPKLWYRNRVLAEKDALR